MTGSARQTKFNYTKRNNLITFFSIFVFNKQQINFVEPKKKDIS